MTIERIGPLDPVQNLKKTGEKTRANRKEGTDSISLSAEAKSKADVYQALEMAKSAPYIRNERVEEVKRKLKDPSYITEKVISELADRLMEYFGIS
ncbi:hypothetical protein ES703_29985 [subsurface metagenome]